VAGPTVTVFHDKFSELAMQLWSDAKRRRPNQRKRKQYLPRNGGKKRTRAMERSDFLKEWLADIGYDAESGSDSDVRGEDEEPEEVDTTSDAVELVSLPEEETTATESHSEAEEWSDDPLDCGMRSSDSASD